MRARAKQLFSEPARARSLFHVVRRFLPGGTQAWMRRLPMLVRANTTLAVGEQDRWNAASTLGQERWMKGRLRRRGWTRHAQRWSWAGPSLRVGLVESVSRAAGRTVTRSVRRAATVPLGLDIDRPDMPRAVYAQPMCGRTSCAIETDWTQRACW